MSQAQAAAPSQASGGPSGNAGPTPPVESGPSFDAKAAIAEIKRARGDVAQVQTAFDSHKKETAGDREILARLRTALSPETKAAPDPIAAFESQMDGFLEQAMEFRSRGVELPVTTKIAMDFYQSQLENLKVIAELKKQVSELKGGVDKANDPEAPANNVAYTQMETFLQQSLDSLYGTDPKQNAAKSRVYGAVTQALSDDLKALQKQNPAQWDMLRRNPMKLQAVVNDVLRTIVPPKALQMIDQEQLQNTPQSAGELWAAFREAQTMFKSAKNHEEKLKALDLQREIRQAIFDIDKPKSKRAPQRR